jgi:hypothetical protein
VCEGGGRVFVCAHGVDVDACSSQVPAGGHPYMLHAGTARHTCSPTLQLLYCAGQLRAPQPNSSAMGTTWSSRSPELSSVHT